MINSLFVPKKRELNCDIRGDVLVNIKFKSNLSAGVFSLVLGAIVWFVVPHQIAADMTKNYGVSSRTLPYGVAFLFMLCGVGLIFQSLVLKKDTTKIINVKTELRAIAYMASLVVFGIILKFSFIVSLAFLGLITLVFMRSRKIHYYLIVIFVAVALYFAFKYGLHATLT